MGKDEESRDARHKETGDLAFAAFANMEGLRIVRAKEYHRGGFTEYRFAFDDPSSEQFPNGRWDQLQMDFVNSVCAKYDMTVMTLKRLCKRNAANGR